MSPTVLIIQRLLPHYRRPFFEQLRAACAQLGIELLLAHGEAQGAEARRKDTVALPWAVSIRNRSVSFGSRSLCWQPCLGLLPRADLVIVEQASRLLLNYPLAMAAELGLVKLCYWGHGRNMQARDPESPAERIKRTLSRRAHWWFAYTGLSAQIIQANGFPARKITDVQNSLDVRELIEARLATRPGELEALRRRLGLRGGNVCLYIGGMYPEKRLDYLVEACEAIRRRVPDFEMLCIGAGQTEGLVRAAAARNDWLRLLPPVFGQDKVPYFLLSKLLLAPRNVGLAILDSFALGVPLVTEAHPGHGPELHYLEDGVNGCIVHAQGSPEAYAERVAALLRDEEARLRLVAGGQLAAGRYTLQNMVQRFSQGIVQALASN